MALDEETKKRDLIKKYIQTNLVAGTDFGKIKMGGRDSKECLFKPGAEKVCSLLHLKPVFKIDIDLKSIVGEGVIPYVCELVNRHSGEIEGEGRGSCSIKEKQGNANVAIKIAQKRAQIDAVLRVAALSDQFTQDLEDMENPSQQKAAVYYPNSAPESNQPPAWDSNEEKVAVCPFGKNKGMPWAEMTFDQLDWYRKRFMENINDPSKENYKAQNQNLLQEVLDALEVK